MDWLFLGLGMAFAGAAGYALGRRRSRSPAAVERGSSDVEHVLDLLRRAHGALVSVLAEDGVEPVVIEDPHHPDAARAARAVALARVSVADGRRHRLEDPAVTVAASHAGVAVALGFAGAVAADATERAQADAWRLAAGIVDQRARIVERPRRTLTDEFPAFGLSETVESAALILCQAIAQLVDQTTAVVLRDEFSGVLRIVRVSGGADRRLEGTSALPGSAVARAVETDAPVAAASLQELLGHPRSDRRRGIDGGLAFPLRESRRPFGALVVFGAPERLDHQERAEIERRVALAGPRVAHLQAVEIREIRARTDELTGLPNRRGLERAMSLHEGDHAALLIVDLDLFKRVNDTHGHIAGDAALRHLAGLLRRALRTQDAAARIGGEEFALWLPDADLTIACEVAERVRETVASAPAVWEGREIPLSCSVGVAAAPETTHAKDNLYALADAALYQAKERGRNRVEVAQPKRGVTLEP